MPKQIDIKNKLVRLNLDDSYYYLGKEDYVDALNITHDAQEQSEDIVNTNITGNRYIPYNKPAGTNVVIGAKPDILRNRIYEFIWNSNGKHSIVIYDKAADKRTKLIENLTDTSGVDVLQFTLLNKIIHVDIIYRGLTEGDLVYYTDGNVSPRKFNVLHLQNQIYSTIKVPFIEAAKMPPSFPITAVYGTDATRNSNSLRKKLVMATYRFSYDDYEKSTFTTYSKIPLPIGYYGSDNDINNTKNNFITFTVQTGDENVTDIEIGVRFNIDNTWLNFIQVIVINKKQLNIPSNTTYNYLFYNDSVYPPFEDVNQTVEGILLFDWVPQIAKSQCSANGNTIEYAAITEGYDAYPQSQLNVTITAANVTNIPPDTSPPSITYTISAATISFVVTGSVPVGTVYKIYIFFNGDPSIGQTYGVRLVGNYTSIAGDTINSVANTLYNQFISYSAVPIIGGSNSLNTWSSVFGSSGYYVTQLIVNPGSSAGTISTEKTWMYNANYIYGLVYKDEQGRTIPGVTTFVNPLNSNNDFLVTTPAFSLGAANAVQTPVVTANINHLPPIGAVTFAWVRRRMTYANFIMYETADFQDPGDGYFYFNLANIEKYKLQNSQFIYGTAPITTESRINIIAGIASSAYNGNLWNQDYEILGLVTRTPTGSSSPTTDNVSYIKVKKPTAVISPTYTANMLVMIYTPLANPTDLANSVYWEWGEEYAIYTLNGVNYHRGKSQDQTGVQPSIYIWNEGDVYFHNRKMFVSSISTGTVIDTVSLMDSNWSDFFLSGVNDNGRGITIVPNARKTFYPATIRFSREYLANTNINQTNRFIYVNLIDLDRSFGSILKMSIKDRYIRIGQQYKLGAVPIFNSISKDAGNSSIRSNTDTLLNPVQYYLGDFGVGDAPECWTDQNYSSYGFDTNRGIWWRLSRDGIVALSILYKFNSWATQHGVLRGYKYKIYGSFDPKANNCIFAFEATDTDDAFTWSFDEENNAYESRLSYHPEFMCQLGELLVTYKNGDTYTHDGTVYNNFYGIQYPSLCTIVYNDQSAVKKKFLALGYKSLNNIVWASATNGDVQTNTINPQTGLQQISNIQDIDYELEEVVLNAAFNFDANSMSNPIEGAAIGDYLGGNYLVIKYTCPVLNSGKLINMSQPYITWIPSGRNF